MLSTEDSLGWFLARLFSIFCITMLLLPAAHASPLLDPPLPIPYRYDGPLIAGVGALLYAIIWRWATRSAVLQGVEIGKTLFRIQMQSLTFGILLLCLAAPALGDTEYGLWYAATYMHVILAGILFAQYTTTQIFPLPCTPPFFLENDDDACSCNGHGCSKCGGGGTSGGQVHRSNESTHA